MTIEEEILEEIVGKSDSGWTLEQELPVGYSENGMGRNLEVDSLLDRIVVNYHTIYSSEGKRQTYPKPWPGPEDVFRWYELDNGQGVGWIMSDPWRFIVIEVPK